MSGGNVPENEKPTHHISKWISWALGSMVSLGTIGTGLFFAVMWHVNMSAEVTQLRKDSTFQYIEVVIMDRETRLDALDRILDGGGVLTTDQLRDQASLINVIVRMNVRRDELIGLSP